MRVWDLGTQHCYQILLGQQGEVNACAFANLPLSQLPCMPCATAL